MAVSVELTREVSEETGDIRREVQHTTEVIPASDEPDYVKLYIRAWCDFKGLDGLRPSDRDVLRYLLPYMGFANDGQLIFVNASMKRLIAERTGLNTRSVSNSLYRLAGCGVLRHVSTGAFAVNPELIGKGSWRDIKQLKATFYVTGPKAGTVEPEVTGPGV